MNKLSINLNDATRDWVRETAGQNAEIFEATNGDELAEIIKSQGSRPFAVVVPSRTESIWWAEYVGATPKNIAFLQGRPKGSSVGLAIVVYNAIETVNEIEDATVIIPKLLDLGYNGKSLAEAIGVNEMTISRAMTRRNQYHDNRAKLNLALNKLYLSKTR